MYRNRVCTLKSENWKVWNKNYFNLLNRYIFNFTFFKIVIFVIIIYLFEYAVNKFPDTIILKKKMEHLNEKFTSEESFFFKFTTILRNLSFSFHQTHCFTTVNFVAFFEIFLFFKHILRFWKKSLYILRNKSSRPSRLIFTIPLLQTCIRALAIIVIIVSNFPSGGTRLMFTSFKARLTVEIILRMRETKKKKRKKKKNRGSDKTA